MKLKEGCLATNENKPHDCKFCHTILIESKQKFKPLIESKNFKRFNYLIELYKPIWLEVTWK